METWARKILRQLQLGNRPFTVEELCRAVARVHGIQVFLRPVAAPRGFDGQGVRVGQTYTIHYRENLDGLQKRRVIFHEIAHLLLGHGSAVGGYVPVAAEEREAECLASIFLEASSGCALAPSRHRLQRVMHSLFEP